MEDIVELYWELRKICKDSYDDIYEIFNGNPEDNPGSFFNMSFNNLTLTLELLDFYKKIWGNARITKAPSIEEARKQNAQRVILIQKMSFIEIMSSLEFCAKKMVTKNKKFGEFNGRIYLSRIMEKSKEIGIIDENKMKLWNGAIRLRNSLVHNNGISEDIAEYHYPDTVIKVKKSSMTQGNLKMFALLTKWVLNEFKNWIIKANS